MMPSNRCLLILAAALVGSLPSQTLANDRDLRATTIPAAMCVPGEATGNAAPNGGAPLRFAYDREYAVFGTQNLPGYVAWSFAHLHCPLPLNNIDLGGNTNDNDISSFNVVYRDADGAAPDSFVEVTLFQNKLASGTGTVVCSWNSNSNMAGGTGYASANVPCAHDVAATAFYHFNIALSTQTRATWPAVEASFVGIRFP